MATLPDLDTTSVSFIAYWHAFNDGGGSEIDPEDALTHGNINSYEIYDNGVIIFYNTTTGREATVRIKKDGWLVAYFDRTENNNQEQSDVANVRGPWDIINDWTVNKTRGDIVQNTLERAVNQLQSEIQTANTYDYTYATADVGLYNYAFPTSTTVTHLSDYDASRDGETDQPRFVYTADTTVNWAYAIGRTYGGYSDSEGRTDFSDGTTIARSTTRNEENYGALELLNSGAIPNAETTYGHDLFSEYVGPLNDPDPVGQGNLLALWE